MSSVPSPEYVAQLEAYIRYSEARTKRLEEERERLLEKCRAEFTQHVRYNLLKAFVNRLDITTQEKNQQVRAQVRAQAHPVVHDYDNHSRAREQARKDREEAIFLVERRAFGDVHERFAARAAVATVAPPPLPPLSGFSVYYPPEEASAAPAPSLEPWAMLEDV